MLHHALENIRQATLGQATREIPLPFIRWKNIGKRKRIDVIDCYWDVKVTGNFAADHITAQTYALNYMEYEHRALSINAPRIPLVAIIADMAKTGHRHQKRSNSWQLSVSDQ